MSHYHYFNIRLNQIVHIGLFFKPSKQQLCMVQANAIRGILVLEELAEK